MIRPAQHFIHCGSLSVSVYLAQGQGQGQYVAPGKGNMHYNTGVKTTGVKTVQSGYGKLKATCMTPPSAPGHATMQCSSASNSCKATCAPEYKFPNGNSVLYLSCVDNEWTVKDSEWEHIPACERKN